MSYENFVRVDVVTPVAIGATSFAIKAAVFPNKLPAADGGYLVVCDSPGNPAWIEVVKYTNRDGLAINGVTRGQEGTTAQAWSGPVYALQTFLAGEANLIQTTLAGKQAEIAQGTLAQYWRGDKTWRDLMTDVRATTLDGLSTASGAWISAADTVLSALGKLQAQASGAASTLSADVRSTLLAGYAVGANAVLAAGDSVLAAFGKVQAQLNAKANSASPTFTGIPAGPTAAPGTNTTQLANTAFVRAEVANLVAAAPGALDTLDELAAALGDDPNFATTVTNSLAGKQPLNARLTSVSAAVLAVNDILIADSTTTMAKLATGAKGRELLAVATDAAGRTALGLGTGALATMTTSTTDSTVGRGLKVGDFGYGAACIYVSGDLNALNYNCLFYTDTNIVNGPYTPGLNAAQLMGQHFQHNSVGYARQEVRSVNNTAYGKWVRYQTASVWSSWSRDLSTLDLPASETDGTLGKVVTTGTLGFGSAIQIYGGHNLNALTQVGEYAFTSGIPLVNSPAVGACFISVIGRSAYPHQVVRQLYTTSMWMRAAKVANPTTAAADWTDWTTDGIYDYGASGNGSYVKFTSGTMICYHRDGSVHNTTNSWSGLYLAPAANFTFPAVFVGVPIVSPNGSWAGGSGSLAWCICTAITASSCQLQAVSAASSGRGLIGYTAVGRWK